MLSPPALCPISPRMCCSHHHLVPIPPPGGVSTRQGPICKDSGAFSSPSVVKFLKSGQEFVPCLHPQEARASPEEVRADSQNCDPSSQQCERNSEHAVGSLAAPGVAAMTPQSAALHFGRAIQRGGAQWCFCCPQTVGARGCAMFT